MEAVPRATTEVRCQPDGDGYLLIVLERGEERARLALSRTAAASVRDVLAEAISRGDANAAVAEGMTLDLPPLDAREARVVVGSALRRMSAGDVAIGFTLFPLPDGRFDWSLEQAGPLGALYDHSVREALGAQAGAPRGTPMSAPIPVFE